MLTHLGPIWIQLYGIGGYRSFNISFEVEISNDKLSGFGVLPISVAIAAVFFFSKGGWQGTLAVLAKLDYGLINRPA